MPSLFPPGYYRPPGWDAPPHPTPTQQGRVKGMLRSLAGDVGKMDEETMRALMPVLQEARKELRESMKSWLANVKDGDKRYTAQEHRRAMVSIERAMEEITKIEPRLAGLLEDMGEGAGHLAARHLEFELARMGQIFGGPGQLGMMPTQIDTAGVIATGRKELIPRFRTSAARYTKNMRDDLRSQFAVGLARGETFHQMTNRLQRLGGPRGMVALRGVKGDPGAIVENISEGLFKRYRHWGERLVRTETINAYNTQHVAAIDELNSDLDEDEKPFGKRWDSSLDRRLCATCNGLDRVYVEHDQQFPGGFDHPPAHPNCRCTVVAWSPEWGDIKGEAKTREFVPEKPPGTGVKKPPRAAAQASGPELREQALAAQRQVREEGRRNIQARRAQERDQILPPPTQRLVNRQQSPEAYENQARWSTTYQQAELAQARQRIRAANPQRQGETPSEWRSRRRAVEAKVRGMTAEDMRAERRGDTARRNALAAQEREAEARQRRESKERDRLAHARAMERDRVRQEALAQERAAKAAREVEQDREYDKLKRVRMDVGKHHRDGFDRGAEGMGMSRKDVMKTFQAPPGHRVRITSASGGKDSMSLGGEIVSNRSGKVIGTISRSLFRNSKGEVEIYHGFLALEKPYQGKFHGNWMITNMFENYERLGVKRVRVSPAWVGQYNWAKVGFKMNREAVRDGVDMLVRFNKPHVASGLITQETADNMVRTWKTDPTAFARMPDLPKIDFTFYNREGREDTNGRLNKAFMMASGPGWTGEIDVGDNKRWRDARKMLDAKRKLYDDAQRGKRARYKANAAARKAARDGE